MTLVALLDFTIILQFQMDRVLFKMAMFGVVVPFYIPTTSTVSLQIKHIGLGYNEHLLVSPLVTVFSATFPFSVLASFEHAK